MAYAAYGMHRGTKDNSILVRDCRQAKYSFCNWLYFI